MKKYILAAFIISSATFAFAQDSSSAGDAVGSLSSEEISLMIQSRMGCSNADMAACAVVAEQTGLPSAQAAYQMIAQADARFEESESSSRSNRRIIRIVIFLVIAAVGGLVFANKRED